LSPQGAAEQRDRSGRGTLAVLDEAANLSPQSQLAESGTPALSPARTDSSTVPGLPVAEGSRGQPVADLAGKAVELRPAAVGRILLGVEQADPQASRPGVPDLLRRPRPH
jgi:hypothetical protein